MIGRLGERLRERRRELKLTLKGVADASGLSTGFISQIERNLTVPSLSSLATVAEILGTSIGELTGQPTKPHPDTYHDKRIQYKLNDGQVQYERLSSVFSGSTLHSVKFSMPSGYRSETVSHHGEEMVFVLRGRIQYKVDKETFILEEGDSLHFNAVTPHSVESLPSSLGFSEVVWTGTLDIFDGEVHEHGETSPLTMSGTEFSDLAR